MIKFSIILSAQDLFIAIVSRGMEVKILREAVTVKWSICSRSQITCLMYRTEKTAAPG